jgi:zinc D-Ala-D-Ala carboxypeptidase
MPPKTQWAPPGNIPYHLRYQDNPTDLIQINLFYDVKVFLNSHAAAAFKQMQGAAANDGIYLQAVSGYRSYQDQEELFNKQIAKHGSRLEASRLSAPPGYSEHHTGYALDIGDMKNQKETLTISFEQGNAFRWLQQNASAYGFELSFPRNNIMNVSYEPWHWRFVGTDTAKEVFREARGMSQASQSLSRSVPYQK